MRPTMVVLALDQLRLGIVGMMNEGRAAGLQFTEDLGDIGLQDVYFCVDQRVEREDDIERCVWGGGERQAVVALKAGV